VQENQIPNFASPSLAASTQMGSSNGRIKPSPYRYIAPNLKTEVPASRVRWQGVTIFDEGTIRTAWEQQEAYVILEIFEVAAKSTQGWISRRMVLQARNASPFHDKATAKKKRQASQSCCA
jgi:hypothetical protein